MNPARGKLLVRPVDTPETLSGGKILLTERTRQDLTSHQMEILAIGAFPYCEDESCEREHWSNEPEPGVYHGRHFFHAKVGDWILVAHRSLSETDTDGVFICAQDAVLAVLTA